MNDTKTKEELEYTGCGCMNEENEDKCDGCLNKAVCPLIQDRPPRPIPGQLQFEL